MLLIGTDPRSGKPNEVATYPDGSASTRVRPGYNVEAPYGQLIIAPETPLISVDFPRGLRTDRVGYVVANGGSAAWDSLEKAAALTITGAIGSSAKVVTHSAMHYGLMAGWSLGTSVKFGTPSAGNSWEVGLEDPDDLTGFAVRQVGTDIYLVAKTMFGDILTHRAQWSEDPLDGTGPSGYNWPHFSNEYVALRTRAQSAVPFAGGTLIVNRTIAHVIDGAPQPGPFFVMPRGRSWRLYVKATNLGGGPGGTMKVRGFDASVLNRYYPELHPWTVDAFGRTADTTENAMIVVRPLSTVSSLYTVNGMVPTVVSCSGSSGTMDVRVYHASDSSTIITGGTWVQDGAHEYNISATAVALGAAKVVGAPLRLSTNVPNGAIRLDGIGGTGASAAPVFAQDGDMLLPRVGGMNTMLIVTAKMTTGTGNFNGAITGGEQIRV